MSKKPVVLCILDGWGHRSDTAYNSIALSKTPVWDQLCATSPMALLDASEHAVGLPWGQMGNSEVGHLNIGSGRVVYQELMRISSALEDGSFYTLPAYEQLIKTTQTVHVCGLLSDGGVHSLDEHLLKIVQDLAQRNIKVVVHAFLDGRDTSPKSAKNYVESFVQATKNLPTVCIGSLSGRYYAMDRDNNWDRITQAVRVVVEGASGAKTSFADPLETIEKAYAEGITDEFVVPCANESYAGMQPGESVFCVNFRADRMRHFVAALLGQGQPPASDISVPDGLSVATMTTYNEAFNNQVHVCYPAKVLPNVLAEVIAKEGLHQLHIAETEKYAHVTFFLNGGQEEPFDNEERILVPSPSVATYDLQPEMSAPKVTDHLVETIQAGTTDFIVVNFANTDMVGHSGNLEAAIKAVEAVDECLGRLVSALKEAGGCLLITADHGNAELMFNEEKGTPHTAHTTNPVPCIVYNAPHVKALNSGSLSDIAPTILELLKLPQPAEMTGKSLVKKHTA